MVITCSPTEPFRQKEVFPCATRPPRQSICPTTRLLVFVVDSVALDFDLDPHKTRVKSRIAFRPNPDATDRRFFLHGENLSLISARIDGRDVTPDLSEDGLTCDTPDGPFLWESEVEIDPANNTALEGLYMSNGMYCTQCEAEGFRKITYYPDRPDVMSVFTVTINGPHPVLLSQWQPGQRRAAQRRMARSLAQARVSFCPGCR
jgi:Aminopeptidase N